MAHDNEAQISSQDENKQKKKHLDMPTPDKDDLRPKTLVFDIFICLIVSLFGFFAFFIFFFLKIPLSKQNHGPHHQCQKSHDSRRSIHQAVDTADVLRFNRAYLITDIWLRN